MNNCVIKSFTFLSTLPYEVVEEFFTCKYGYQRNAESSNLYLEEIAQKESNQLFGLNLIDFIKQQKGKRKKQFNKGLSIEKFVNQYPLGTFLISVSGHCFAAVNGLIKDVNVKWKMEILNVWEIK
jgi:hypothetical protein